MSTRKDLKPVSTIQRRALIDSSTINKDARTVDVVFVTENKVRMYNWNIGEFDEILSCDPNSVRKQRLDNGAPVLDNHDRWSGTEGVLGVVDAYKFADNEGRATLRFSKREDVEGVWQDIQDGILKGISVGYRVWKYQDMNPLRRDDEIPEYKAIDWEPMEISIAPVQADAGSGVRDTKEGDNDQKDPFPELITTRSISTKKTTIMADENKETGTGTEGTRTDNQTPAVTPVTPVAPVNVDEVRNQATTEERNRVKTINDAVRTAGLDETFASELIEKGTTIDAARAAIIEKWADKDPNKGQRSDPKVVADEATKVRTAQIDALAMRAMPEITRGDKPEITSERAEAAKPYRSMTLLDVAKDSLIRAGVDIKGMDKMDIVGRAITNSTSDFPVLLDGTNRRVLLAAYNAIADTWRRFAVAGSVSDFRDHKRLRMGSFTNLEDVGENQEYKNKNIPDAEYEKIAAKTKGNIINVSRQMIINDDLAGFTRLASMLGRAAARSIESDVYALLLSNAGAGPTMADGVALFHANHGNIGTGSALGVAGLDADRVLMAQQKEPSGNDFLDIRPQVLVVPIGLGSAAKILNTSVYDPDATNKLQRPNSVNGMFSDIVDTPRLTGTVRYLFANPNEEPVFEVAFLDGNQSPYLESMQEFKVDGMSWKVRMDYGVGAIGWRGVVKNAGV